ncbi:MAG: Rieske (2Fe-2S) protein [Thermoanaerobaculia bacterium]
MADDPRSRRSALKSIVWISVGAAGLWRFLTPRSTSAAAPPIAVRIEDVPTNGALVMPQHGVAIVREGPAVSALDLACTHLGCMVTANPGGFACACHGSRFDRSGGRVSGPATGSLRRLQTVEEGGVVLVAKLPESEGEA